MNMKCVCGATVPLHSRSSLCQSCLNAPDPDDPGGYDYYDYNDDDDGDDFDGDDDFHIREDFGWFGVDAMMEE
jgi:hypothetical protein